MMNVVVNNMFDAFDKLHCKVITLINNGILQGKKKEYHISSVKLILVEEVAYASNNSKVSFVV